MRHWRPGTADKLEMLDRYAAPSPPRRGPRDWVVDAALVLFAASFGVLTASGRLGGSNPSIPTWLFNVDQVVGVLGCAALWLRRRWPVALAVVLVLLSAFSELVAGAMLVALFTVAAHRPTRTVAGVFALSVVSAITYVAWRVEPDLPSGLVLIMGGALQVAAVGWGMVVHRQRQLLVRVGQEAELRADQAQHQAREAVAREMHDVLGHRLSLLSLHAGALEYRPDAPAEDVAHAAKVIRQSAHQALQDLREIIGVLRAPVGELPQPTIADIHELVSESDEAGMRVDIREEMVGSVPDQAGRTAYRVVQEGLTNAHRHAPGAKVCVQVSGEPGQGLSVEVRNTAPATVPNPAASSGQGLAGLAERVALVHGRLDHGPTSDGGWAMSAWIPWPA